MKPIYKMLVAGMLATATASPALQASPLVSTVGVPSQQQVTITDALAYRILARVVGSLEAQLNQSLSTDFLFREYKAGRVSISYLGFDGIEYIFSVSYLDGLGTVSIEEF
jgi:hypothetical protein